MKSIGLIGKVAMYVMMLVSIVLCVLSAQEGDAGAKADGSMTGVALIWSYIILGLGVVAAIVSAIFGAIINSGNILKSLIVVVACIALVLICWSLSDSTPLKIIGYEGTENCEPWLNIADTSIFLFYFIGAAAVLAIIYSEVIKFFK